MVNAGSSHGKGATNLCVRPSRCLSTSSKASPGRCSRSTPSIRIWAVVLCVSRSMELRVWNDEWWSGCDQIKKTTFPICFAQPLWEVHHQLNGRLSIPFCSRPHLPCLVHGRHSFWRLDLQPHQPCLHARGHSPVTQPSARGGGAGQAHGLELRRPPHHRKRCTQGPHPLHHPMASSSECGGGQQLQRGVHGVEQLPVRRGHQGQGSSGGLLWGGGGAARHCWRQLQGQLWLLLRWWLGQRRWSCCCSCCS